MIIYGEINALSEFRKKSLIDKAKNAGQPIESIEAEYLHFVDTPDTKKLSGEDDQKLRQLLDYGDKFKGLRDGKLILVTPRFGTISPWSSKATDIVHNAGLAQVERVERGIAYYIKPTHSSDLQKIAGLLHDRMTETFMFDTEGAEKLFASAKPQTYQEIDIKGGREALVKANQELGLALDDNEIDYLLKAYGALKRNPSDVELMMFAQVNSEHCRHKIFNADWVVDGQKQPKSLFKMIKNTFEKGGEDVLSAYKDNAAVLKGNEAERLFVNKTGEFKYHKEPIHPVIKVETHNHPTAIAPDPGAATGIGGEIRDEAATGRGAKSKMGLNGFTVSSLLIPGNLRPWESDCGKPDRIVSALDIMLHGPIGGAGFANEFGRPNLYGYFRTYQREVGGEQYGFHKPIMIAGGVGNIREQHIAKKHLRSSHLILVLGGPSMLIGLGGGAASSMHTGQSSADLDFASVQRGNGEMERRTQEVIDKCWALGADNPIITIHDVGAGGLSNALPELVHDSGKGAEFELRDIPNAEPGLTPLEIWCNESQERYVLAIEPGDLEQFDEICRRERCPYAVVGKVTDKAQLVLNDSKFKNQPINIPTELLFGNPPKMTKNVMSAVFEAAGMTTATGAVNTSEPKQSEIDISEAAERVLKHPAVGSKKFLITIGDRSVGGLVARDQMIGKWQVPVSDVAVSATSFKSNQGEAMAMGERPPVAVTNPAAAARLAVGEAITNIAAADIEKLKDIKLSANWMAASGHKDQDYALYESVKAVGEEFAPDLGLTIPVGKDSLSMRTTWQDSDGQKSVSSPVSLVISSFTPVKNVLKTLTPELQNVRASRLIYIDLGINNALEGSILSEVYDMTYGETPDIDPKTLKDFFGALTAMKAEGKILAYHDRSDGGLFVTLAEMSFASRLGLNIDLGKLPGQTLNKLFNESLGVVVQVDQKNLGSVLKAFGSHAYDIGQVTSSQEINIKDGNFVYQSTRAELETIWAETSYLIQKLRDNPSGADSEYALIKDNNDPGLTPSFSFGLEAKKYTSRPKVAIFREQGVNGQLEMAAAFDRAGFTSVDVHLNDIISGRYDLSEFAGLAACGGFSYGDVLGAGEGWAKTILFDDQLRGKFEAFFARPNTFSLGVCNGCQALAALKEIIPGAEDWPRFLRNSSEQFEARTVMTEVMESPSVLFKDMAGAKLPVPVAHGEGRAEGMGKNAFSTLRYTDNQGKPTETYPFNPNGSPVGLTGFTTKDGRANILMPHPERAFLTRQLSWHPKEWDEESPWFKIFLNARNFIG